MLFAKSIQRILIFNIVVFIVSCKIPFQGAAKAELVNIYEGPVTTYHQSCKECHGDNGSKYTFVFKTLSDDALADKIHNMMTGPAQLIAPQEDEIKAMVEYHRALRDKKVFLLVNNAVSVRDGFDTTIKGNVTPGASVELRKGNAVLSAQEENGEWSISGVPKPPFTLIARKDGQESSFQFPDRQNNQL